MGEPGRPENNVSCLSLHLHRRTVIQSRIEEIKIAPRCVLFQPGIQVPVDLRQALETAFIVANVGQQYGCLQRRSPGRARVGVPMNRSVASAGKIRMDRRAKNAPVDIQHQARTSKELGEDFVEIRALADVPQRLSVMQWDDAVELLWTSIPGPAIPEVGANECGDLADAIASQTIEIGAVLLNNLKGCRLRCWTTVPPKPRVC